MKPISKDLSNQETYFVIIHNDLDLERKYMVLAYICISDDKNFNFVRYKTYHHQFVVKFTNYKNHKYFANQMNHLRTIVTFKSILLPML